MKKSVLIVLLLILSSCALFTQEGEPTLPPIPEPLPEETLLPVEPAPVKAPEVEAPLPPPMNINVISKSTCIAQTDYDECVTTATMDGTTVGLEPIVQKADAAILVKTTYSIDGKQVWQHPSVPTEYYTQVNSEMFLTWRVR